MRSILCAAYFEVALEASNSEINATSFRGQLFRECWLQPEGSDMWVTGRIWPVFQTWAWWRRISTVMAKWWGAFGWVVLFPEVCGWNDFYSWKARDLGWFIFATPSLGKQPAPCSTLHHHHHRSPQSHFIPLNMDSVILSYQHLQFPSSLLFQWTSIIIPQHGQLYIWIVTYIIQFWGKFCFAMKIGTPQTTR